MVDSVPWGRRLAILRQKMGRVLRACDVAHVKRLKRIGCSEAFDEAYKDTYPCKEYIGLAVTTATVNGHDPPVVMMSMKFGLSLGVIDDRYVPN